MAESAKMSEENRKVFDEFKKMLSEANL